jgi:hypothetical protein
MRDTKNHVKFGQKLSWCLHSLKSSTLLPICYQNRSLQIVDMNWSYSIRLVTLLHKIFFLSKVTFGKSAVPQMIVHPIWHVLNLQIVKIIAFVCHFKILCSFLFAAFKKWSKKFSFVQLKVNDGEYCTEYPIVCVNYCVKNKCTNAIEAITEICSNPQLSVTGKSCCDKMRNSPNTHCRVEQDCPTGLTCMNDSFNAKCICHEYSKLERVNRTVFFSIFFQNKPRRVLDLVLVICLGR